MKITITLDDTYAELLAECPALVHEIEKSAAVLLVNAEQRRVDAYLLPNDGHNGNLQALSQT